MPQPIEVVRVDQGNLAAVVSLFDEYRQFYGQEQDVARAKQFLAARVTQRDSVIFLARQGSVGCGFTQLFPSFSSVAMQKIWILNDLYVKSAFRRQGVGQKLLSHAANFARGDGALRLILATEKNNDVAQQLYESRGWSRDERFFHYQFQL